MTTKVVSDRMVFEINDIARNSNRLMKSLWNSSRKIYKEATENRNIIKGIYETTNYKVMSSGELAVSRANDLLNALKIALQCVMLIADKHQIYVMNLRQIINELIEKIDATLIMIELSEHEDSLWSKIQ